MPGRAATAGGIGPPGAGGALIGTGGIIGGAPIMLGSTAMRLL
jgi:hypothetical protein